MPVYCGTAFCIIMRCLSLPVRAPGKFLCCMYGARYFVYRLPLKFHRFEYGPQVGCRFLQCCTRLLPFCVWFLHVNYKRSMWFLQFFVFFLHVVAMLYVVLAILVYCSCMFVLESRMWFLPFCVWLLHASDRILQTFCRIPIGFL